MIEQPQINKRIWKNTNVVKKVNFGQTCTVSRIELECDGTIYSGKFGSLLEYVDSSDGCKREVSQGNMYVVNCVESDLLGVSRTRARVCVS